MLAEDRRSVIEEGCILKPLQGLSAGTIALRAPLAAIQRLAAQ